MTTTHELLQESELRTPAETLLEEMKGWAMVMPVLGNIELQGRHVGMQAIRSRILPNGLALFCSNTFNVLPRPRRHDYSGLFDGTETDSDKISHAWHHVDEDDVRGHKVWLYDLHGDEITSKHTHERSEVQRILYGRVELNGRIINAGQGLIIKPGDYHRTTAIGGAIVLCALMGAAGEESEQIHKF